MTAQTYRSSVRIKVLGPVEASVDEVGVVLGGPQQRLLLALLVSANGETVSADRLIEQIWGDDPPAAARKNVQVYIHRLRSILGDVIETAGTGYRLVGVATDVAAFEDLHTEASRPGIAPARVAEVLRDALALWRGPAYADVRDSLALTAEVARLEDLRILVLADRMQADLDLGRHGAVVGELDGAVREYPLQERFRAQLMTALYRSGRHVEALRAYEQYRRYLGEEMGLEPSAELRELESRILAGDQELLGQFDPADAGMAETVRGYEIREPVATGSDSETFRAYHRSMGREVRLRVLGPSLADRAEFIATFLHTTKEIAALDNPHVGFVYDTWREPGRAFQVSRWFDGGSLQDQLARGSMGRGAALVMLEQIGGALAAAHREGITHGRVAPSNVVFDTSGDAYLVDFSVGTEPTSVRDDLVAFARLAAAALPDERSDTAADVATAVALAQDGELERVEDLLRHLRQALGADGVGAAPASGEPQHRSPARNPYKGLQAFQELDAADFCGRDDVVARVLALLEQSRLVSVVGPSGSGKSSLVKAGVLPALRSAAHGGDRTPLVTEMFPGAYPFEELEIALLRVGVERTSLIDDLLGDDRGLLRVVKQIVPDADSEIVLVIDQFEELFSMVGDDRTRRLFVDSLVNAVADPRGQLRVIVTMRADFFDRPLQYPDFGALFEAGLVPVSVPGERELAAAIAQPAASVGVEYAPGVISRIADDVAGEAGGLPLLQYALTEMFEHRRGDEITLADYERTGGVLGALGQRAEEIFVSLPAGAQLALRQALLRMVTVDHGIDDLRRRVLQAELRTLDCDPRDLEFAIQQFGNHRLLTFDLDPGSRGPTAEIAHEALVREWPRLANWIEEQSADLALRRRLDAAVADWENAGQDDSYLLRGGRLAQFDDWANATTLALTEGEREFVAASAEREAFLADRAASRRRRLTVVLACVAAVLAVLAGFALVQRGNAIDNAERADAAVVLANDAAAEAEVARSDAERAGSAAETERLAAIGPSVAASDPPLGLLLAAEAYRRDASPQTLGGLQAALLGAGPVQQFFGEGALQVKWVEGGIVTLGREWVRRFDGDSRSQTGEMAVEIESPASPFHLPSWSDGPPDPFGVSPDARFAAVVVDGAARLIDFDRSTSVEVAATGPTALGFSNDGALLAVGTSSAEVVIYSVPALLEVDRIQLPDRERSFADYPEIAESSGQFPAVEEWTMRGVSTVAFDDEDRRLVVSYGPVVRLWDLTEGEQIGEGALLRTVDFDFPYTPETLSIRGEVIRAQGYQTVTVMDASTMSITAVEMIPTGRSLTDFSARTVRYVPIDEEHGLAAYSDGRLLRFTAGDQLEAALVSVTPIPVTLTEGLDLSPDGTSYVVAGGNASYVATLTGSTLLSDALPGHEAGQELGVSSDGTIVTDTDSFSEPVVWDRSGPTPVAVTPTRDVFELALDAGYESPDWQLDIKTVRPGVDRFVEQSYGYADVFDGTDLASPPFRVSNVNYISAFSPDGAWYAAQRCTERDDFDVTFFQQDRCSFHGVNVIDATTGDVVAELLIDVEESTTSQTSSIQWTADSKLLLIVDAGRLRTFETETWTETDTFTESLSMLGASGGITTVRSSPGGSYLASVFFDGTLTLNDGVGGWELQVFDGLGAGSPSARGPWFSADDRSMVTTIDGAARLWDVETKQQIGVPFPNDVGVAPGGADGEIPQLVTKVDGVLHVWNLDVSTWVDVACAAAGRNLSTGEWRQFGPRDTRYRRTCPEHPLGGQ